MRRIISILITAILIFSIVSVSAASNPPRSVLSFYLRNGLTWGNSKKSTLNKMKEEGLEYYDKHDYLLSELPLDKGKNEVWIYGVDGVSLGNKNETVMFQVVGTKKHGLFEMTYIITINKGDRNKRFTSLKASLEKKYGKMQMKKNYNAYKQVAWKYLDDDTYVSVYILNDSSDDELVVAYASPDRSTIVSSLKDGSYYVQTPYGL